MPRIVVPASLQKKLGNEATDLLRDDFLEFLRVGEYDQLVFGKDSGFKRPKLAKDEELRHVHMIPVTELEELGRWMARYKHRSRKTSSKVLVYARGFKDPECYLLIDILDSPDGHDRMDQDEELIRLFAETAERFRNLY